MIKTNLTVYSARAFGGREVTSAEVTPKREFFPSTSLDMTAGGSATQT